MGKYVGGRVYGYVVCIYIVYLRFSGNHAVYEIKWKKYGRARQATSDSTVYLSNK
jgi:hypothetical protein